MNWLKYLVGLAALTIAGCAAYFSVTGLGVLFSGASIAVMIMAGSLEFAKLVTATYLKQKWSEVRGFNKVYLTLSVGLLMLITSAGIFGYLSNAFQQQNIKLEQVQRGIDVYNTKLSQNTIQINQISQQLDDFNKNQGKIIDGGTVNNRLLKSIDNRDKEIAKYNLKIGELQDSSLKWNEKINEIKNNNIDLEKEVGGFRFVAEAFGLELKTVVKFFIFLIVIVFDPLAIALIIAFNGLIVKKKDEDTAMADKTYEVYGEKSSYSKDSGKNLPENPVIVEKTHKNPEENQVIVENSLPDEEPVQEVEFIPNEPEETAQSKTTWPEIVR